MMLFRIEDVQSEEGRCRRYALSEEELPHMRLSELEGYIANEVRKEINGSSDRKLLSYSRSLGVCLLKYNEYTDNELHLLDGFHDNCIWYYDCSNAQFKVTGYNIYHGFLDIPEGWPDRAIVLQNFSLDVSDNEQVNRYLSYFTKTGRKKYVSPEKDREVVWMQSPYDLVISQYTDAVYLLYALVSKYGMSSNLYVNLWNEINTLRDFRFEYASGTEKMALLKVVEYLYWYQNTEREIGRKVFQDSLQGDRITASYDPIQQLHDIQRESFWDSYALSDYNSNILSDRIWELYSREFS